MSEYEFTLRQKLLDNYDLADVITLLNLTLEDLVDEILEQVMDNPEYFRDLFGDDYEEEETN